MKILLSVLLLAALSERVSALVKEHIYVDDMVSWFKAQTYCRNNYNDLSTIESEEEYLRFISTTGNQIDGWIGLYKKSDAVKYEQWSDGNPVTYTILSENLQTPFEQCVYSRNDVGYWEAVDCSNVIATFFCYTVPDLVLVKKNRSWEEALQYCRANYIDLASLTSKTDLITANNIVNGTTDNVWTSLRFLAGHWFWVNGETLDSQMLLPSCPISPNHCGARNFNANRWELKDCDKELYFFCYTEKVTKGGASNAPSNLISDATKLATGMVTGR